MTASDEEPFKNTEIGKTEIAGEFIPPTELVSFAPGTMLGPWKLEKELGRGGMGIVFAARGPKNDLVALKVLRDPSRGKLVERFLRETHALGRLDHPNIVQLLDYGTRGNVPYYVMTYVPGDTLESLLHKGSLPRRQVVKILSDVARGVAHAHGNGIVHRDLKPENIMVTAELVPKIMDFGIARVKADEGPKLTRTGAPMGTPAYMAPEQFRGQRADARTDIYALGTMLYEAVERRPPFEVGTDYHALAKAVVEDAPPRPNADPVLTATILKALAKDPIDRQQTALELARELETWLAGARETPLPDSGRRQSSRRVPMAMTPVPPSRAPDASSSAPLLVAFVLVVLGAVGAAWWLHPVSTTPPLVSPPVSSVPPTAPPPPPAAPSAPPAPPPTTPGESAIAIAASDVKVIAIEKEWSPYSESGLTVSLPSEPETSSESLRVRTRNGNTLYLKGRGLSLALADGRALHANVFQVPPGSGTTDEVLLMVARGLADAEKAKPPELTPVASRPLARALALELAGGAKLTARLEASGQSVFVVSVLSKGDPGVEGARFLDSMRAGD